MSFSTFIVFCRNGLTLPSKWASRIRFNGTYCSYWIVFLPLQRVCHLAECLITLLNLYSRKTRNLGSGHFYLESRTWQRIFYRKIWVGRHFQGDCRFLTMGQEYEGTAIPLFKGWSLGSLQGKRSPGQMFSTSQSMPGRVIGREGGTAEAYHKLGIKGRIYVFRSLDDMNTLPKRSFLFTAIVWVLWALTIYSLYFPGNSRCYVQYQSQSHGP